MAEGVAIVATLLETREIRKSFPPVKALDGVSFDVRAGEIHALVGENGAGKSTLMKILSGVYPTGTFDGEIAMETGTQRFAGIRDAQRAGVAIVFQEFSLVPEMSIAENVFLGHFPARAGLMDWNRLHADAHAILRTLGVELPTSARVAELGIGQQQLVEIAKALSQDARVLILDEPTAALNQAESAQLFAIVRGLRERGLGIIYISHRLDEVLDLADRITILRDGRTVATHARGEIDRNKMIALMVGREVSQMFASSQRNVGAVMLEAYGISVAHPAIAGREVLRNVSFAVHRGEVVGLAGLMGAGRTALLNVLFGSFPKPYRGEIAIGGRVVRVRVPQEAIAAGVALVTEDRKKLGLSLQASVAENMTLVALRRFASATVLRKQEEIAEVERMMSALGVRANSPETVVGALSGGNQQKVVLGKWLMQRPTVLLLDEPTRGIDVGARQEIYTRIDALAAEGLSIVVASSDMEELRGLCDRILVMHEGRITADLAREQATPERIMAHATGALEVA
jgi:D-xylose transport system ATP-binding protein